MKLDHIPNLNREIKKVLLEQEKHKFPLVIHFNEGMEFPEFKITIEKTEVDTYVDATGQRWKKVK